MQEILVRAYLHRMNYLGSRRERFGFKIVVIQNDLFLCPCLMTTHSYVTVEDFIVHRSTKRSQIEKNGTKEITMQGCSYDPKGSFGSEKVGG